MAKGQKKGGGSSSGLSKKSPSSHAHGGGGGKSSSSQFPDDNAFNLDLDVIADEQNSNTMDLSWTELGQAFVSILLCALVSVMVGVAAGIAISIQYLDPQDAMVLVGSEGGGSGEKHQQAQPQILFHHSRITIWDPLIASHSPLAGGSDPIMIDGNRVSNLDRILLLVEESPPLTGSPGLDGDSAEEGSNANDTSLTYDKLPLVDPPVGSFEQYSQVKPALCNDGHTYGFDSWNRLVEAFQEANSYSAHRFMRWNKYFATTKETFKGVFDAPMHYYDEDIVLTICPGALIYGKRGPLAFVNAENIVLECDDCTIEVKYGSHFSFGPHAKNILFRGIRFRGSSSTSLLFHHDGAEVSLEDCYFLENSASIKQLGTVADVNSSSVVNFYRCLMKNGPADRMTGSTSLSIRAKDAEL